MFSIRIRLLLLLLPITLAILSALGYFHYVKSTAYVSAVTNQSLQTIVATKQAALAEHIESTKKLGAAIANSGIVQSYIGLTNRSLTGNNLNTRQKMADRVEDLLHSIQDAHWGRYHHIFLINRSNRIVISPTHGRNEAGTSTILFDKDLSRNRWAMDALHKGKTTLSDYWSWQTEEHNHQMLFYPIRDAANRIQAVIGIEMQIPYQQQIINQGFNLGSSGRIYLTTVKGAPVTQKGAQNQPLLTGDALDQTRLAGTWSGRRMNAQGREILGYYVRDPQYPWILAGEVETAETFAAVDQLHIVLATGLLVLVLVMLAVSIVFTNGIERPLRALVPQIERISRGEFTIEILDSERKDDIGKLVMALQQLVFSLQLVSKKLRQAKTLKKAS